MIQLNECDLTLKDIVACGISCGGPLDSKTGVILSPPNLLSWDNVPIVRMVESRLGIKTFLKNDADVCALAEWKYGAAKDYENIIFLTFGTGLGAALIFNNKLYTGANNMAGEVGHIRLENFGPVGYGKIGSFEGFCSGGGITQLAKMMILEEKQKGQNNSKLYLLDESGINAKNIAKYAREGDELSLKVFQTVGKYFGRGLSIITDILNPQIIIVGGIYMRVNDLIDPTIFDEIKKETLLQSNKVKIVPAKLNEKIGDYASLVVGKYGLENEI